MTTTIGDILTSGKSDDFSNVKISHSMKSKLLNVMKDTERNAKHKSFVKCVEWAKTCDTAELLDKGVM